MDKPQKKEDRGGILVLGMHRSGTSALTRVVNLLGADLPTSVYGPGSGSDNPTGFWESQELNPLHDEILESAGSFWDDWRRIDPPWFNSPEADRFRHRLAAYIEQDFSNSSLFVIKNPRACLFVPLWLRAMKDCGVTPKPLIPIRNPLEVAASLRRRNGFEAQKSYLIWLRYVLEAERSTRSLPRCFITYDALLDDWRNAADAMKRQLAIEWPDRSDKAAENIDAFLSARHRHHSRPTEDLDARPDVADWVKQTYGALLAMAQSGDASVYREKLDSVYAAFGTATEIFGPVFGAEHQAARNEINRREALLTARAEEIHDLEEQLEMHHKEIELLHEEMEQLREETEQRQTELYNIKHSTVWRLTTPLRTGLSRFPRVARSLSGLLQFTWWTVTLQLPRRLAALRQGNEAAHISGPASLSRHYRVICLPVIDWDFRYQRPQQLMTQFAEADHPVFYVALNFNRKLKTREIKPGVLEVTLPGSPALNAYRSTLRPAAAESAADALIQLLEPESTDPTVCIVQLPFWLPLAEALASRLRCPIVYDCMDDHAGFTTNTRFMLEKEHRLTTHADLVVASSPLLAERVESIAQRSILVRNATDYDHFARVDAPPESNREQLHVGYFGAIADWFDIELVAEIAKARPTWRFSLIGSTVGADTETLASLPNLRLRGEKPYADLPDLMRPWDCCIIPFLRCPLTDATNPVKVYEMLSAGKPVVAVPLPELAPIAEQGLIQVAEDAQSFIAAIENSVHSNSPEAITQRRAFARENTWNQRFQVLDRHIRQLWPLVSVIIVIGDDREITRSCLTSLLGETNYPNFEVILLDDHATDDAPKCPDDPVRRDPRVRIVSKDSSLDLAGAYNQGLKAAKGEYLCLLENDTAVPPGWLSGLIAQLREAPESGLAGPVTGDFFYMAMSRQVYTTVGDLTEDPGAGMSMHDNYRRRVGVTEFTPWPDLEGFEHHQSSTSKLGKAV